MSPPLCQILKVGARTPQGLNAAQFAMCARAAKMEPRRTSVYDRRGNAIGAVRAYCLPDTLVGYDRMVALAVPALREAALTDAGEPSFGPIPLLLAVPEAGRPDDDVRFGPEMLSELAEKSSVPIDLERSLVVRAGHAGAGLALELSALRLYGSGGDAVRSPAVLVGGVDSYFHPEVLQWLDRERRLHSATADNGILPGEGAGFVLLSAGEPEKGKPTRTPMASVLAVVSGREETVLSGEPCLATAMTSVVRQALSAAGSPPPAWVLTDVNGERHRISEWSKVLIRLKDSWPEEMRRETPVDEMGDTGAASGALLLALACTYFQAGCAPSKRALIALHAEGIERSALVIEGNTEVAPNAVRIEAIESPAKREAPIHKETIDRVILSLARLPAAFNRGPVKGALEEALSVLSRWETSDLEAPDHLALLDEVKDRVGEAKGMLSQAGESGESSARSLGHVERSLRAARDKTIDRLVAVQSKARRGEAPSKASQQDVFFASVGSPVVYAAPVKPLLPLVRVDRALEDDDDDEPARPRFGEGNEPPSLDLVQIRALARDCMEDIAILGTLRHPHEDEAWSAVDRFEQRLLSNQDALLSLNRLVPHEPSSADVLPEVLRYAMEPVFADPGRAFARAFSLGCVAGDDTIRAVVSGMRASHPVTHQAQEEALSLASSPAIVPAMSRLLFDDDPRMVQIALNVLHFKRAASFSSVLPLLSHPEPGVLRAALRCLSVVDPRAHAIEALIEASGQASDDRTAFFAAESLVLLGAPSGLTWMAERLREEDSPRAVAIAAPVRAEILRVLALSGGPSHRDALFRAAVSSADTVEAIGWYGDVALVAPLLDELAKANEARLAKASLYPTDYEIAAARALLRITGIYLEDPDDEGGLGLSTRAELWREPFRELMETLPFGAKIRFGKPYLPSASLAEVEDDESNQEARTRAAFELSALSMTVWGFEPGDWVSRQRAEIEAMRGQLAAVEPEYEPGEWPEAYVARRGGASIS